MRAVNITSIDKDLTRITNFQKTKSNNLRLALGMALLFYSSAAKELKLKVRRFLGLVPAFGTPLKYFFFIKTMKI